MSVRCMCPSGSPKKGDLGPILLPILEGEFRQLHITWRTTAPKEAVLTFPRLEEAAALELLRKVRWELLVEPYRSWWDEDAQVPTLRVWHACQSYCRTIQRAA